MKMIQNNRILILLFGLTSLCQAQVATKKATRTYYAQPGVQSIESINEFERSAINSIQLIHFYYKNGKSKDPNYQSTSELFSLLEREIEDVITFGKVNLERPQLAPLAGRYRINQTPTILLLKDGIEVARLEGLIDVDRIKTIITNSFGSTIEKYKTWRLKREKELAEYRRMYPPYYYSPYYSPWGYGYGYSPFYPGFGFGLGYGFGRYRRGYGRYYW